MSIDMLYQHDLQNTLEMLPQIPFTNPTRGRCFSNKADGVICYDTFTSGTDLHCCNMILILALRRLVSVSWLMILLHSELEKL